jgi:S-methyl-5-thioribose-1-phosphate isomerase
MDTPDVLAWRDGYIEALDQTALPHQVRTLRITTVDQLVEAITTLAVRGAPVLGAAGALGVALAVRQGGREGWDAARLDAEIKRIADARPTAVNLRREVTAVAGCIPQGRAAVEAAALAVVGSSVTASERISRRGADWLRQTCGPGRLRIHTHCNTGSLACLGWGTALGVIRALHADGALAHVIVDETRPLLQGARLTCWELGQLGIEHRLACDGAAPFLISQHLADAVVVGADRVAANGDVANKIGTYSLALAARAAGIPFLVAAPESTLDSSTPSGAAIPIELRADEEVTGQAAPAGTRALNFAFDITPAELVSAVVTEERVIPRLSRRLFRWPPLEAELALRVGEAAVAVDADGFLRRVGHDDERARAERPARKNASAPDQRPGQAPAAGPGVGLDVLVTGQPAAGVAHPELGQQAAVGERAEPGRLPRLGQPPPGPGPPVQVGAAVAVAADAQVARLLPVVVGFQPPDLGFGVLARRRLGRGAAQHGGALELQARGQELRRYLLRVVPGVHAQREVLGLRELGGEPGQPAVPGARFRPAGEQQEVAPPEGGVVRAADDRVVAPVGDLGPLEPAQRQVGTEAERRYLHRPILAGGSVSSVCGE